MKTKNKQMRIGIDARCLMEGARTGVEEYTIGFVRRLLEQDSENTYVLFLNSFLNALLVSLNIKRPMRAFIIATKSAVAINPING